MNNKNSTKQELRDNACVKQIVLMQNLHIIACIFHKKSEIRNHRGGNVDPATSKGAFLSLVACCHSVSFFFPGHGGKLETQEWAEIGTIVVKSNIQTYHGLLEWHIR